MYDYIEVNHAINDAWDAFFEKLEGHGLDESSIAEAMDEKGLFNLMRDCIQTTEENKANG